MRSLFESATVQEINDRLSRLSADSARQWGKMTPAQALAHCSVGLEMATGDQKPPRMLLGRIFGPLVKSKALGGEPLRRNAPTSRDFIISDSRDFQAERKRLLSLIHRFSTAGPNGCTTHPHTFFGPMTPTEWSTLMYKHLDHHLRQFGA